MLTWLVTMTYCPFSLPWTFLHSPWPISVFLCSSAFSFYSLLPLIICYPCSSVSLLFARSSVLFQLFPRSPSSLSSPPPHISFLLSSALSFCRPSPLLPISLLRSSPPFFPSYLLTTVRRDRFAFSTTASSFTHRNADLHCHLLAAVITIWQRSTPEDGSGRMKDR